uniref:Uncharacterized protein n=1 Tax=Tetranychus urticae TaxID=32264 RepID=A0A158P4G7_TETUR
MLYMKGSHDELDDGDETDGVKCGEMKMLMKMKMRLMILMTGNHYQEICV